MTAEQNPEEASPSRVSSEEETPLLSGSQAADNRTPYRRRVIAVSFLMIFFLEFGAGIVVPSYTSVMEDDICWQLHPDVVRAAPNGGGDDICRGLDVQGKLAMLRGWQAALDSVPGIVATVPYGILSDKWGRKPILGLSLLGMNLSVMAAYVVLYLPRTFPVELTLVTSFIMLIGGSPSVAQAMFYSSIADVADVAERAPIFFRLIATKLIAEVISNPLAGVIVLKSPWFGLLLSLGLFIIANMLVFAFPETVHLQKQTKTPDDAADSTHPFEGSEVDPVDIKSASMTQILQKTRKTVRAALGYVAANGGTVLLAMSLIFIVLGRFVQYLLLQYVTKRYDWSWSKATFLLTIRSVCNLIVLLFILPWASHYCVTRLNVPAMLKDAWIARFSGAASVLGSLIIAVAFNPYALCVGLAIFATGGGFNAAIRSLLNALVEPQHIGMLNSILSFMEMVGFMFAGPALSQALRVGMELGGAWIGLPFLCASLIFLVSTAIVFVFRVPRSRRGDISSNETGVEG